MNKNIRFYDSLLETAFKLFVFFFSVIACFVDTQYSTKVGTASFFVFSLSFFGEFMLLTGKASNNNKILFGVLLGCFSLVFSLLPILIPNCRLMNLTLCMFFLLYFVFLFLLFCDFIHYLTTGDTEDSTLTI